MPKQLADLVAVVTQHGEDIGTLKGDVAVLKTDVAVLKTDVAQLKDDMVEVKGDIRTLNSRVADLSGTNLESKIVTSLPPYISQMLGLERTPAGSPATHAYISPQPVHGRGLQSCGRWTDQR